MHPLSRLLLALRSTILLALVVAGSFAACGGGQTTAPTPAATPAIRTLFVRLGGLPAITAIVDELFANLAADDRVSSFFVASDTARLKQHFVDQLCAAAGGPCVYSGRTMAVAHAGLHITNSHFYAVVEELVKALDTLRIPELERSDLLGIIATLEADVVGR